MKLPFPKSKSEYPFYIFLYWIVIWSFFILYSSINIISSLTPDGRYVEKTDCIAKNGLGCKTYSKPYYVPVGAEIKYSFIDEGVYIGLSTIVIGGILMLRHKSDRKRSG